MADYTSNTITIGTVTTASIASTNSTTRIGNYFVTSAEQTSKDVTVKMDSYEVISVPENIIYESFVTKYIMRAVDPDCGVLTYVYWISPNEPDTTGSLYSGSRCGASPLIDIVVIETYKELA